MCHHCCHHHCHCYPNWYWRWQPAPIVCQPVVVYPPVVHQPVDFRPHLKITNSPPASAVAAAINKLRG